MVAPRTTAYEGVVPWYVALAVLTWLTSTTGAMRFSTEPFDPRGRATLVCRMSNEADAGRRVRVEALDDAGHATFDSGPFTLAGGASFVIGGGVEARRCRFTVVGEIAGVRAHGLVVSPGAGAVSLVPRPER